MLLRRSLRPGSQLVRHRVASLCTSTRIDPLFHPGPEARGGWWEPGYTRWDPTKTHLPGPRVVTYEARPLSLMLRMRPQPQALRLRPRSRDLPQDPGWTGPGPTPTSPRPAQTQLRPHRTHLDPSWTCHADLPWTCPDPVGPTLDPIGPTRPRPRPRQTRPGPRRAAPDRDPAPPG